MDQKDVMQKTVSDAGPRQAERDRREQERDRRADEALRRTQHMYVHLPVGRLYAKVALPGSVSMLLSALYQLFEGLFVGNFLGEQAFAAVNLATPFVIINFAFVDMIGVGSSVLISLALGRKKDREADEVFTLSVLMVIVLSTVLGVLLYFGAPPIMTAMGATGAFHHEAVVFLRVYAVFSPFITLVDAVDNYLKDCGAVTYSLAVNIVLAVLGVALDYLFVAVLGWGVAGAAAGFCVAQLVAVIMAMIPLASGRLRLHFVCPRWDMAAVRGIVGNGLPDFLDNIAGRLFSIALNSALVRFGGSAAVSVYGIVQYVDGVFLPIMYGVVDAAQPAIGYNWGAGLKKRVRALVRLDFIVCGAACGLLCGGRARCAALACARVRALHAGLPARHGGGRPAAHGHHLCGALGRLRHCLCVPGALTGARGRGALGGLCFRVPVPRARRALASGADGHLAQHAGDHGAHRRGVAGAVCVASPAGVTNVSGKTVMMALWIIG